MTKSRQKNSKENKLLFHYRFFFIQLFFQGNLKVTFISVKSHCCSVKILLKPSSSVPEFGKNNTQKKNQPSSPTVWKYGLALIVLSTMFSHPHIQPNDLCLNLTIWSMSSKNCTKFRIGWCDNKSWVPAISRDHSLIHLFRNGIYHPHEQLCYIYR